MCLQHAESAFEGYKRGERCLFSVCVCVCVCFRFFSTSESKKKSTYATIHE